MEEKLETNFLQKFIAPRNNCTSQTCWGTGHSSMAWALVGEIAICPAEMIVPRYLTEVFLN